MKLKRRVKRKEKKIEILLDQKLIIH